MNSATRTGEPRIRQEPAQLVPAAAAPELHPVLDEYSRSQDQLGHMLPVCVTPRRRLTCRQSSGDSLELEEGERFSGLADRPARGFRTERVACRGALSELARGPQQRRPGLVRLLRRLHRTQYAQRAPG